MKKKFVAILLCILAAVITISFGGCFGSCYRGCDKLHTFPTAASVRKRLKEMWDLDLPADDYLTLVNYASDIGVRGDGDLLYVLDYNGGDADFNSLLITEKDKKFEESFAGIYKYLKDDFFSEYEFPGFTANYNWLYLEKSSDGDTSLMNLRLFIICFVEENQLLIDFFRL